ncbi:MAG: T9SS type A sorting domain-containing protein [Bacteroidetes bacterium]|nr:T9SS type A sorting domain-containing protein [Bacteroidota bacterium]
MYGFLLFLSLIVLPAGAARALPEAIAEAEAPLPDSLRIVVIGSSTAAGFGASTTDSAWVWRYRDYLTQLNPAYAVVNLAVGGYSTYQLQPDSFVTPDGRPRVDTLHNITRALALHPSAVIVNLPSNDAASNFSILEQTENYERLAAEAARAKVPMWVCTTQPRDLSEAKRQNLITMRDWIRGRFADNTLDFWTGLAREDGTIDPKFDSGDGIHFNDDGHAALFVRVRESAIPDRLEQITWIAAAEPTSFDIAIYPNPAREHATLRLRMQSAGTVRISVQDLLGREMLRERERYAPAGDVFTRLQLSQLPSGMYLCVVQSPEGSALQRLLVTN